jgi:hypothetical protein
MDAFPRVRLFSALQSRPAPLQASGHLSTNLSPPQTSSASSDRPQDSRTALAILSVTSAQEGAGCRCGTRRWDCASGRADGDAQLLPGPRLQASRLTEVDPKTVRRVPVVDAPEIRQRVRDLAGERRSFGYRRFDVPLAQEELTMNPQML